MVLGSSVARWSIGREQGLRPSLSISATVCTAREEEEEREAERWPGG